MLDIILKILFPLIDFFWKQWANTEERKKDYVAFLVKMARQGNRSALNRLSAMEQIEAVKELWKKEGQ